VFVGPDLSAPPSLRLTDRRLVTATSVAAGDVTRDEVVALDKKVSEQMASARKFAIESPLPPAETALDHVFA